MKQNQDKNNFILGLAVGIAVVSLGGMIMMSLGNKGENGNTAKKEEPTNKEPTNNNQPQEPSKTKASEYFAQIAKNIGADTGEFSKCLSSKKYSNRVNADYQQGVKLGVRGTPANIINGRLVSGAIPYSQIADIIDNGTISGEEVDIEITDKDWYRGNKDAKITIVEFSDIQCPFCSRHHDTMKQIAENYPNDVKWIYKHFPLDSIHPMARKASEAAECAGEQDKFWEYLDNLFENQRDLSNLTN